MGGSAGASTAGNGAGGSASGAAGAGTSGSGGTAGGTGGAGASFPIQAILTKLVVAPNHDFVVAGSAYKNAPFQNQELSRFSSDWQSLWSSNAPDAAGVWHPDVWASAPVSVTDIAVTSQGEVVTVGGNTIVEADGGMLYTQYLAKFDADGALLWSKALPGHFPPENLNLAVDGTDKIVIFTYIQNEGSDLQRYDTDGTLLWDKHWAPLSNITELPVGNTTKPLPEVLATDATGNIYLNAVLAPMVHIQKLSPDGDVLWSSSVGYDYAIAVTADGSRLYGVGEQLTAYDGKTGTVLWTRGVATASCAADASTCADQRELASVAAVDGNAIVSGRTSGIVLDQSDVTTAPNGSDGFALSFDPDGNLLWAHEYGPEPGVTSVFFAGNVASGPPGAAFAYFGQQKSGRIYNLLP